MEIEKDKNYEIIVFPNQDIGLKAQQALIARNIGFKHISTDKSQGLWRVNLSCVRSQIFTGRAEAFKLYAFVNGIRIQ